VGEALRRGLRLVICVTLALAAGMRGRAGADGAAACGPFGNPPAKMYAAHKPACGSGEMLGPWKDGDGTDRYACLYAPQAHEPGARLPLLVYLHPSLFGAWTVKWTKLLDLASTTALGEGTAHGYIVLAPEGRNTAHRYPWPDNTGFGWDNWYRQLSPGDLKIGGLVYPENVDAAAIDHFIAEAAHSGMVDTRRIYVSGWSNGAAMAVLYAVNRPDVAAAAVYSAPDPFGALTDPCPQTPVAHAPANRGEVTIFNTHAAIMNVHNACDIEGICPNSGKLARELRATGAEFEDVIVDAGGKRVTACVADCGINPNGGLSLLQSPISWFLALHRHGNWPDQWTPAMLDFLRAHPLHPAAPQF
jgi:predicted esterase